MLFLLGSSNTDMVMQVPKLPAPGETVIGGTLTVVQGGKGANQAVAAARAGGRVTFVGAYGSDSFGQNAAHALTAEGIDTRFFVQLNGVASGVALINVDAGGENNITVASGANGLVQPHHADAVAALFQPGDLLLVQHEIPAETVEYAIRTARAAGLTVLLNPAPARSVPPEILALVDYLIPNETETELLTGILPTDETATTAAVDQLRALGVGNVLITLGARGVWLADATGQRLVPGFRVEAVDTTAAGDVFCGAFAVALSEGQPLADAVRFACAAAAISVTRLGAQPSAPTRAEIEAMVSP